MDNNSLFYKTKLFKRFCQHYFSNKNMITNMKMRRKTSCDKIRILIIAQFPEVWNSVKSVYEAADERENIEILVLCVPKYNSAHDTEFQGNIQKNDMYEFLKNTDVRCVPAYNVEEESWFEVAKYAPNYVIYTRAYNEQIPRIYASDVLCKISKTCFIPYAYNMIDSEFHTTFNWPFITNINYIFVASESRLNLCKKEYYFQHKFKVNQFFYLGFPRFDITASIESNSKVKKTIAWLPRWSVKDNGLNKKSNFLDYHLKFLDYAKKYPDIDFIIRPHPMMFKSLEDNKVLSKEAIENYKKECSDCKNIEVDNQEDYLQLIEKADILIADYTSLLVEFFITGKPIIYCDNAEGLSLEAIQMDQCLYHAKTFEEIQDILDKLLENKDDLKEERLKTAQIFVPTNKEYIGRDIIEFLIKKS